jgi:hypothetical protein
LLQRRRLAQTAPISAHRSSTIQSNSRLPCSALAALGLPVTPLRLVRFTGCENTRSAVRSGSSACAITDGRTSSGATASISEVSALLACQSSPSATLKSRTRSLRVRN